MRTGSCGAETGTGSLLSPGVLVPQSQSSGCSPGPHAASCRCPTGLGSPTCKMATPPSQAVCRQGGEPCAQYHRHLRMDFGSPASLQPAGCLEHAGFESWTICFVRWASQWVQPVVGTSSSCLWWVFGFSSATPSSTIPLGCASPRQLPCLTEPQFLHLEIEAGQCGEQPCVAWK